MVQSKLLLQFRNLRHYFFNISDTKVLSRYNMDERNVVYAQQLHTNRVVLIDNYGRYFKGVDGLVTKSKVLLGVKTADCLSIFFYDPKVNVVAAIHAGWKGLFGNIIKNTVRVMMSLGTNPRDIRAAVGPHIKVCCYKPPKQRILKFLSLGFSKTICQNHQSDWFLNLSKVAEIQMIKEGLNQEFIDICAICTCCDKRFYSYRRQGKVLNAINNVIGLK